MRLMDPFQRILERSRFQRFIARFRYPVSLPEDVAVALGIDLSNFLTFDQFVGCLCSCLPTRIRKFMPRDEAEEAFQSAISKERFLRNTLCSYEFNQGRIVFVLKFDEEGRLRRMYLQHKLISSDQGLEIPLAWEPTKEYHSVPMAHYAGRI